MSRGTAYTLLARRLGIHIEECHMSVMSRELAERVPAAVEAIKKWIPAQ